MGWIVGSRTLLIGKHAPRHGNLPIRREITSMRKKREYRACIARFDDLLARRDLEPEQRDAIEASRRLIKELSRIRNPSQAEVFRYVGEVSERLLKVFRKQ